MLASQKAQRSIIEQLEIHQAEDHLMNSRSSELQLKDVKFRVRSSHNYHKNDLFDRILWYILPTHPPNTKTDQMLAKYFTYNLNPIYEKISKLPQQIFVCGYCKEIYYGPSQFLLHCLDTDCPIDHDRSTYFFYFKNRFSQVKTSDIQKTLDSNELKGLREISYRKKRLIFSKIDVKPLQKNSNQILICGNCGYKSQNVNFHFNSFFIPHCFFVCKSTRHPLNSHMLSPIECKQDSTAFVDDIINLAVNFNVITLFKDSYVRMEQNPKFSNQNTYKNFCANCKSNFSHQAKFIQHCLFECKEKPNPQSSHLFQRKMVAVPFKMEKNQKKQIIKEFSQQKRELERAQVKDKVKKKSPPMNSEDKRPNKLQNRNKEQMKKWDKRINPNLEQLKDFLENTYFCGQCLNHFQDEKKYLSHCFFYLCPLNQQRNSHFFFEKDSETPLTMKSLQNLVNQAKIEQPSDKVRENPQLQKAITEYIQLIDTETNEVVRSGNFENLHCGKCGQNFKKKYFYVNHCLKLCYSQNHEKSSHLIRYAKNKAVNDEEFKDFLKSYLYAIQILQFEPNKKYKVVKNEFIDVDPDFLCGKCDTLFENLYEYVLHSISVCNNMRCKYSSHFLVHMFVRSKDQVQYPLDVVFGEYLGVKLWKTNKANRIQKNQGKIQRPEPMDIEKSQIEEFKQISKFELVSREKPENLKEKDENSNLLQQLISQQNNTNVLPRLLRHNVNFQYHENISKLFFYEGYYCGQCEITFRREAEFQDHLNECQSFQHPNSSHFFVENPRYEEIFANQILDSRNYKNLRQTFSQFERIHQENFTCGCGETGPIKKFISHTKKFHYYEVPEGSSHVILRLVFFKCNNQILNITLPVNLKGIKSEQKWICPCKPWKKYSYEEFVKHIDKRHERRSPKFWMKFQGLP